MSSRNKAKQKINCQTKIEAVDSALRSKKRKEQANQTLYIARI